MTDGGKFLVVGSETKEYLKFNVKMQNFGEDAFDTIVEVKYSKQLSWNEVSKEQQTILSQKIYTFIRQKSKSCKKLIIISLCY